MSLFNSYDKPGKGVEPDAPQKRGFFRFFDIYFRKFWYFGKATLLYSVALIPTFIIAYAFIFVVSLAINPDGGVEVFLSALIFANAYVALWGAGPATAGMTYIMRNYAREEHAWLWSDFKENLISNFRQSILVFIFDLIAVVIFYVALVVYGSTPGILGMFKYVMYIIIFVFTIMHFYIYPIMVTFDMPLKAIYKNAALFAVCKGPINLFVFAVHVLLHIGLPMWAIFNGGTYWVLLLLIILMLETVLTQGFSAFLTNFCVYPTMKQYMLDVVEAQTKAENNANDSEEF